MLGKNVCRILAVLIAVCFLLPAGIVGSMNFEKSEIGKLTHGFPVDTKIDAEGSRHPRADNRHYRAQCGGNARGRRNHGAGRPDEPAGSVLPQKQKNIP